MYKLIIEGGNQVNGEVKISGSKNAVLPILFSSILADTPLRLTNVPKLTDVSTSLKILMDMGSNSTTEADGTICIDSSNLTNLNADYALVKTMRASILALASIISLAWPSRKTFCCLTCARSFCNCWIASPWCLSISSAILICFFDLGLWAYARCADQLSPHN